MKTCRGILSEVGSSLLSVDKRLSAVEIDVDITSNVANYNGSPVCEVTLGGIHCPWLCRQCS